MPAGRPLESSQTADVVIVGGGVIGLSIARALAKYGVRNVIVVERNEFAREASWAAGGILAPQVEADEDDNFFRIACASRDLYPEFTKALQSETGIDVQLDTTGTLYVAFAEDEEAEFRARFAWQQGQHLAVEWLDPDGARKLEPLLSERVRYALRFPNDFQVENRRLVNALLMANERLGVRLSRDCEAIAIRTEKARAAGIETTQGFISAPLIVLAAGAWTSSIASSTALPQIEIKPVRGQMLSFNPSKQLARHVIYSSRGYLIPRSDGRLLAGSTTETAGFEKRVTDEGVYAINSMAVEILPALAWLPVDTSWAGFRPCAKDGLPVLGPTKQIDGLFYATGHYRNGILLAPITGELIAEAIISRSSPALLSAFSPDRFEALT
ncbi:MAG TPA: glycine oxidase ThiO [Pyrinomonadaceae bacterium]|nr:glycine oxidase ThiO [Pyrinomonadaceae bacterium]